PGRGVCFDCENIDADAQGEDGNIAVVSSKMFEDLKVLLLEITLLLYKKCGVNFSYAVSFGLKAAKTVKLLSVLKIERIVELIHYGAFNYNNKLSKLLNNPKEVANEYEGQMVTSITVLYAQALVPKLAELSKADDKGILWEVLRTHFGEELIRVPKDKSTLGLNDVRNYLAFKEGKNILLQPIRSIAQHKGLNGTEVARVILRPSTQVLPTIVTDVTTVAEGSWDSLAPTRLSQSSKEKDKDSEFKIRIGVNATERYAAEKNDMDVDNNDEMDVETDQAVDNEKALRIQMGCLEVLARLIVRALVLIYKKLLRTTFRIQK
ncbi:hypothetical protein HDU96_004022, partial [Phlyctochytrium bullatum]